MSEVDEEFKDSQEKIIDRASQIDFVNKTPWETYRLGMKHGIDIAMEEIDIAIAMEEIDIAMEENK